MIADLTLETTDNNHTGPLGPLFDTPGKRIRALRQAKGWTQDRLAEEIEERGFNIGGDSAKSFVSQIELSRRDLPRYLYPVLAEIFGTTTDYLFMLTDVPGRQQRGPVLSPEAEAAASILEELTAIERAEVLAIVRQAAIQIRQRNSSAAEVSSRLNDTLRLAGIMLSPGTVARIEMLFADFLRAQGINPLPGILDSLSEDIGHNDL